MPRVHAQPTALKMPGLARLCPCKHQGLSTRAQPQRTTSAAASLVAFRNIAGHCHHCSPLIIIAVSAAAVWQAVEHAPHGSGPTNKTTTHALPPSHAPPHSTAHGPCRASACWRWAMTRGPSAAPPPAPTRGHPRTDLFGAATKTTPAGHCGLRVGLVRPPGESCHKPQTPSPGCDGCAKGAEMWRRGLGGTGGL